MINIDNLTKVFRAKNSADVVALNEIDLEIPKGSFTLLKGSSGCGKSTLLFSIGGMLKPSSGSVYYNQENIYSYSGDKLRGFLSHQVGFVYQSYHLIPYLTIMDNILLLNKVQSHKITSQEVREYAKELNIENRLTHLPKQLSVGERQRAALIRALITKPQILIADEPTGNLDPLNSQIIMQHFTNFQQKGGTVIMASHGNEADSLASQTVRMERGKIIY